MNDNEVLLADVEPSWLEDGLGLSGEQTDPDLGDDTQWETRAWSAQNQAPEDFINGPPSCNPGNPPSTGTHIFGVVDGDCQWIDTTVC